MEEAHLTHVAESCVHDVAPPFSSNPSAVLGANVLTSNLSSRWYTPFGTKVPGSSVHFFVQNGKTLTVYLSKLELYFEVTILNLYLW